MYDEPVAGIEYPDTQLECVQRMHPGKMAGEPCDRPAHERALRKLPLPYSLALRLRDAGVAPEIVSEYMGVEEMALEGIYRMAEAKLDAALQSGGRDPAGVADGRPEHEC